ncbi:MAG: phospholipase D family protein [Sulfurimonas sp.]
MKILSSANEIEKNICAFIEKFDNISMSVAWASANSKAFKVLIEEKNKKKIQSSTVGLHFYQTDSKFIEKFLDDERLQFYTKNKDEGVFHPKIYLFWNNEKDWVCLTGSANFRYYVANAQN